MKLFDLALFITGLLGPIASEYLLGGVLPNFLKIRLLDLLKNRNKALYKKVALKLMSPPKTSNFYFWPSIVTYICLVTVMLQESDILQIAGGIGALLGALVLLASGMLLSESRFNTPVQWGHKYAVNASIKHLIKSDSNTAHQFLIEIVQKRSFTSWRTVLKMLCQKPKKWAVPIYELGIKNGDPQESERALNALAKADPQYLSKNISKFLRFRRDSIQTGLLNNIARLTPGAAAQVVKKFKKARSPQVRDKVEFADEVLKTQELIKKMVKMREEHLYKVYAGSLRLLKKELTSGSAASVRSTRLVLSGFSKPEDWFPLLTKIEENPTASPLLPIIHRLRKGYGSQGLKVLIELIEEENPAIRLEVANALFVNPDIGLDVIESLGKSISTHHREVGIRLLPRLSPAKQLSIIEALWQEEYPLVMLSIVDILPKCEWQAPMMDTLKWAINFDEFGIRLKALAVFKALKAPQHLRILLEIYEDSMKNTDKEEDGFKLEIAKTISSLLEIHPLFTTPVEQLFCPDCLARTQPKLIRKWTIPVCKKCSQYIQLVPNIAFVTGVIGPVPSLVEQPKGHHYFSIWDPISKKIIPGEINKLEIRKGMDLDYNWAISAAMELLEAQKAALGKTVEVKLKAAPLLDQNTQNILDRYASQA